MREDDENRSWGTFIGILCFFWILVKGDFLLMIPATLFKSGGDGLACVLFAILIAWGMKQVTYRVLSNKIFSKIVTTLFVCYMIVTKILASLLYVYMDKLSIQDILIIYIPNIIMLLCGITVIYEFWGNWDMKENIWRNRISILFLPYILITQLIVFLSSKYTFPVQFDKNTYFAAEHSFYPFIDSHLRYYSGFLTIYMIFLLIKKTNHHLFK